MYNNTGGIVVIKVGTEYKIIPPTYNIYKMKKSVKGIGNTIPHLYTCVYMEQLEIRYCLPRI